MMAGSHVAVGVATWAWAAPHLGFPVLDPSAFLLAIGGALLPDIDHPQSWVGRRVRVISHPLAALTGHDRHDTAVVLGSGCRRNSMRRSLPPSQAQGNAVRISATGYQ